MFIGSSRRAVLQRVLWPLVLAQFVWLVGCKPSSAPTSVRPETPTPAVVTGVLNRLPQPNSISTIADDRLRQLAGAGALDCGQVELGQSPDNATACVLRMHVERKPFHVRYAAQGIDSQIGIGFAGDADGQVFALEYDSMELSSEGLPKNKRLTDGNHITIEECSKPVNLRKARNGNVTCFLRDL